MFHFFTTIIQLVGFAMVAGAAVAYRDRPASIPKAALPGVGVCVLGFILGHGLPWSVVAVLAATYLFLSAVAGCAMTVWKTVGRASAIPTGTLAFAAFDVLALSGWAAAGSATWLIVLAAWASTLWGLAFTAWVVGLVARAFAAPMLARRKSEADAAIARMQAEQRVADEGEGW